MNEIEYRPWGRYEVLLDDPTTKVKRITVEPQRKLSYQYHHKRQECWMLSRFFASFSTFRKFLDVFGCAQMRSDAFGRIRIHLDTFGKVRTF